MSRSLLVRSHCAIKAASDKAVFKPLELMGRMMGFQIDGLTSRMNACDSGGHRLGQDATSRHPATSRSSLCNPHECQEADPRSALPVAELGAFLKTLLVGGN